MCGEAEAPSLSWRGPARVHRARVEHGPGRCLCAVLGRCSCTRQPCVGASPLTEEAGRVHFGWVLCHCPSRLHCPPSLSRSQGPLPRASLFWLLGSLAKQGPGGGHRQRQGARRRRRRYQIGCQQSSPAHRLGLGPPFQAQVCSHCLSSLVQPSACAFEVNCQDV